MTEAQTYFEQLKELAKTLERCLNGVPAGRLHERPGLHLNPIGWNVFHLLRIWDLDLNWCCKGQSQLEDAWHRGGFSERSGYNPDGKGTVAHGLGFGYTDAEVDELRMDVGVLLQYQAMLLAESGAYLLDAGPDELAQESASLVSATQMRSNAQRIRHTIGHGYAHVGEIRYAKGVLGLPDNEHLRPAR